MLGIDGGNPTKYLLASFAIGDHGLNPSAIIIGTGIITKPYAPAFDSVA